MTVVDGRFGEDVSLSLNVEGFYQWEKGNLVLLGNPEDA